MLVIIFLLWFYAAQDGFIRLYIVKYGLIWSLRLHSLYYKCMWLQMVADGSSYICTYYMFLYCICIWINMVAYCFTLLNIVANSHCRRSVHRKVLHICVLLMWIHMIASPQYNAILNLVWQGIILNFNDNLFHM